MKRRKKDNWQDSQAKVLCCVCSQFFLTPKQCLECSNWNVCMPCLDKEREENLKVLRSRGIVI